MKHIIQPSLALLVISLLASACSPKNESIVSAGSTNSIVSATSTNKPRFTIAASDLAVPAEIGTNGVGSGHETVVVHLQLSASRSDDFRVFTRDHINQGVQLLVGTKIVAEPHIVAEISGGKADLSFSSAAEARAVFDSLNKR